MDLYYTGLPDECYALLKHFFSSSFFLFFFFFFSPAYYGLLDVATSGVSVWNGEMTESTASVPALFIPRSWLRRRNVNKQTKKVIGSLWRIVINTSWLTRSGSLRAEDRIQNQEYRSQLLYSITRIGLSIAVDNLLQVSRLMIASNMVSSEVSIISRINCYLDRSTVLCCVSAWCDICPSGHLTSGG